MKETEEEKDIKAEFGKNGEYIKVVRKGEDSQYYIAIYRIFVESQEGFKSQEEAEKVANELLSKLQDSF